MTVEDLICLVSSRMVMNFISLISTVLWGFTLVPFKDCFSVETFIIYREQMFLNHMLVLLNYMVFRKIADDQSYEIGNS